MCGPANVPVTVIAPGAAPLLGPSLWLGWILILCTTRARNMPYWVHFGIALTWLTAGCARLGVGLV